MVLEVLWSLWQERRFDPVHRCSRIREFGSNLQNLSRKVELGFGQLVEALYVVSRERQAQGNKVRVELLDGARSDDCRGHTGTAVDPSERNSGYGSGARWPISLNAISKRSRRGVRSILRPEGIFLFSSD